jgi:hypothetical protein
MAPYGRSLWTAGGELFATDEAYANLARLGENCEQSSCAEGVCFRRDDQEAVCTRVLWTGQTGCDSPHTMCSHGNTCFEDTCARTARTGWGNLTPHMQQQVIGVIDYVVVQTVDKVYDMFKGRSSNAADIRRATATHALMLLRTYGLDEELLSPVQTVASERLLQLLASPAPDMLRSPVPSIADVGDTYDIADINPDELAALQNALQEGTFTVDGENIVIPPEILQQIQQQQDFQQNQQRLQQKGAWGKIAAFFLSLYMNMKLYIFAISMYMKSMLQP